MRSRRASLLAGVTRRSRELWPSMACCTVRVAALPDRCCDLPERPAALLPGRRRWRAVCCAARRMRALCWGTSSPSASSSFGEPGHAAGGLGSVAGKAGSPELNLLAMCAGVRCTQGFVPVPEPAREGASQARLVPSAFAVGQKAAQPSAAVPSVPRCGTAQPLRGPLPAAAVWLPRAGFPVHPSAGPRPGSLDPEKSNDWSPCPAALTPTMLMIWRKRRRPRTWKRMRSEPASPAAKPMQAPS